PHRQVPERDPVTRGVDVEGLVGRGAAIRVAEVPVAADVVAGLEARVGELPVGEGLAGGEAADPGTDHAGGGLLSHEAARSLGNWLAGQFGVSRSGPLDLGRPVDPEAVEEILRPAVEGVEPAGQD